MVVHRAVKATINRLANECFAASLSGDFYCSKRDNNTWMWASHGRFIPEPDLIDTSAYSEVRDIMYNSLAGLLGMVVIDVK